MNPYIRCPVYETEHFKLRLVKLKDAADLVECYKTPTLAVQGSAANCFVGPGGYGSQTKREMQKFIRSWLGAYRRHQFVRWSVIDRQRGMAIGSVEMFGHSNFPLGNGGVLRIDLLESYETEAYVSELLQLAIDQFYALFDAGIMVTNGMLGAEVRLDAISAAGFIPCDWPDPSRKNYYSRKVA